MLDSEGSHVLAAKNTHEDKNFVDMEREIVHLRKELKDKKEVVRVLKDKVNDYE